MVFLATKTIREKPCLVGLDSRSHIEVNNKSVSKDVISDGTFSGQENREHRRIAPKSKPMM